MRKKEIPDVLIKSVLSVNERVKTRVRVNSELSKEFMVNVRIH